MRVPQGERDRALLNEAASLLAADRSPAELFEALCDLLARFVEAAVVFIALRDADQLLMAHIYDHGEVRRKTDDVIDPRAISWHTLRTGSSQLFRSTADWAGVTQRFPVNAERPETANSVSAIFVPLLNGGTALGVLSVQSPTSDAYDTSDVTLLEAIARYLAIAVRNQQLFERIREASERDPVTGLLNHSRLLEAIDERLRERDGSQLVVVLLDITHFGMINDTYGLVVGDRVLSDFAERLASLVDDRTFAGRLGGDDFAIVATRDDRPAIDRLLASIESRTGGMTFAIDGIDLPVSINSGYVIAPEEGDTRARLISLADLRMRSSMLHGGLMIGKEPAPIARFGEFSKIEPIVEAALARDPYMRVHILHVNHLAHAWSHRLGLDVRDYELFVQAAFLHDIGKLLISDAILMKPARLTAEEYATMKRHARFGEQILALEPGFADVACIVGQHHEWIDGCGYPLGLKGPQIGYLARAVSIIDAFSAMTLDRPYHAASTENDALDELERYAGRQFDADLVRSFVSWRRGRD